MERKQRMPVASKERTAVTDGAIGLDEYRHACHRF